MVFLGVAELEVVSASTVGEKADSPQPHGVAFQEKKYTSYKGGMLEAAACCFLVCAKGRGSQ